MSNECLQNCDFSTPFCADVLCFSSLLLLVPLFLSLRFLRPLCAFFGKNSRVSGKECARARPHRNRKEERERKVFATEIFYEFVLSLKGCAAGPRCHGTIRHQVEVCRLNVELGRVWNTIFGQVNLCTLIFGQKLVVCSFVIA